MDILFSIASGLGLRILCINVPDPASRLTPVFIGLWEGALSHLMISPNPEGGQLSTDLFLAYALRLVFDIVLTRNLARALAIVLWTGISLWLCQAIDNESQPQPSAPRKRSRRHRTPNPPSLPSHIRIYQPPQSQPDSKPDNSVDPLPLRVETPSHERANTPPSIFLQGEDPSEALYFSPATVPAPPPTAVPLRCTSTSVIQLKADEVSSQEKPTILPTPPATTVSVEVDKDSTHSARRLSTIAEAPSGEDASASVITNARVTDRSQFRTDNVRMTLPEKKDQDQSGTTTKTDTVPLPVPDPYMRQSRPKPEPTHPAAADPTPPTFISVNPVTAAKFLLRPYTAEDEVLSDELQTPLNPVARALLEEDANNVFSDNEMDELQTPLKLARQVADGPLSPLSPLLSVQVNLRDAEQVNAQYAETGREHNLKSSTVTGASEAALARNSLLMSSEAELESPGSEAESSLLSTTVPNELYAHGDDWRKKAREEEKRYSEFKHQYDAAMRQLRVKEALLLKGKLSEIDMKIKKLHEKAAKRYYKARNAPGQIRVVDVHGLRVQEAVDITEKALRTALSSGHMTLKVITGKGLHSKNKLPVLKLAIIRAMEQQKINCEPDPTNSGALILTLPT